ncbi:MAG: ABC transporter permease subunit [Candidatus Bathyarchaeia archaeon]
MKLQDIGIRTYVGLFILFVYLPIILMIVLSTNNSGAISFPYQGFTTKWYNAVPTGYEYGSYISAYYDWAFWQAFQNTVYVAFMASIMTTIIVTCVAMALRHRILGRNALFYIILLGFLVPGVALGLGNNILFKIMNWQFTWWIAAMLDTVYAVPFGLILMMARFDPDLVLYERAASVLRASPMNVFRRVTLPLIRWEVVSAAIFGFVLAWGELIRTSFVASGTGVIATYINTQLAINPITPKWYAVGAIITGISIIALVIMGWVLSRGQKK